MLYFLDLFGTFAFALGGAYKAKSRKLNIFGVIFLGAITAVGGGTIRDLIIGRTPLFYLKDPAYLIICLVAGILAYFLPDFVNKTYSIFRFTDSIGLAAFLIIGVSVSHTHLFPFGFEPSTMSALSCIFLGMLTGFGGGVLRDSILGNTPYALKGGSNYVMSAFWGAFIYYLISFINPYLAALISFAITIILREVISRYGLYKKFLKK